jgi:hypothetical protein
MGGEGGRIVQIRKTYREVNPELLYDEIRDFAVKHGTAVGESKMETYSQATDSSSFITRGILTLTVPDAATKTQKECCRVHIVGSARGETKLMLDFDERLFPPEKVTALQSDVDFIFAGYEVKPV